MSVAPTLTTRVSAVNAMLASIGERPVNDIDNPSRLDVQRAVRALNQITVLAQTRGWWFNREEKVPLSPNAAGEYDVPKTVLKVDAYYKYIWQFVRRGNRLYNAETRLYTGNTEDLYVNWVVLLPFDDCPETFRAYVGRRAGMLFQAGAVGSPTLFEFTQVDVDEAWGFLQDEEMEQDDSNLTFSPELIDVVYRR